MRNVPAEMLAMLYLVRAELIEGSVTPDAFPQVWESVIRPSLESITKMADEKKLAGRMAEGLPRR